ncbi:MAG: hypothetical protein HFE63_09410 [Clostridiales bacterium]|nr:hypothetical protein [Clostridiales bacterium]
MKSIRKIAAIFAAMLIITAMFSGCRNEKELLGYFDIVKRGCDSAIALDSGEIMVYEAFKPEIDIESKQLFTKVTETYIKFIQNSGLEYDFTASEKLVSTDEVVGLYEATQENGSLIVSRNGEKVSNDEAPDIFKYFKIDYTIADIENIEVLSASNGVTLYAVTMTDSYVRGFDSEADGQKFDCDKVVYNYYIDSEGVTRSVLSEYTYTFTADSASQTVVHFEQASLN